ncbi:MAG: CHAT domain-containing protein [Deltaproteobacteria bacterium]|nr:CHAT domain-containing protein [Deltaproteobacteria bacterium]
MEQLRIIDKRNESIDLKQVEIRLHSRGQEFSNIANYFPSPIGEKFQQQINWYFNEYLLQPYGKQRKIAQRVVSNISEYGNVMGEKLFGERNSQNSILNDIDEIGLQNIIVTIESNHPDFFDEPWEILTLPGSKQNLATSCSGFIRTKPSDLSPEIRLEVNIENPLRILMVISRPKSDKDEYSDYKTKSHDIFNHLLGYNKSFEVEVLSLANMDNLQERLKKKDKPIHILHFDGPVSLSQGVENNRSGQLIFEDKNRNAKPQRVENICKLAVENGINIIMLDSINDATNNSLSNQSNIAIDLIQNGVKGVITLANSTYTFSNTQIFQIIYSQIAQGDSLSQALVKARKFMKDNCEQNSLTAEKQDFHDWLLPIHYGLQDISLFSESQEGVPFIQSNKFTDLLSNLVGFTFDYLPPNEFFGRNPEHHTIEQLLFNNKAVVIHGESGIGKTHFIHQFAYWSIVKKNVEKVFYFNFGLNPIDSEQILNLIGQVIDGDSADIDRTKEKIKSQNFLIIFDGLEIKEYSEEFKNFLKEIENGSSGLLIGKRDQDKPEFLNDISMVHLEGLSTQERRQYGVRVLQKNQKEDEEGNPDYLKLLDTLEGHPAATETLLSQLGQKQADDILIDLNKERDLIKRNSTNISEISLALLELGWKNLSIDFQHIMAAFADLNGFISDALSIAFDMKNENALSSGDEFFEILDIKRIPMYDLFKAGVNAGFFVQKPFGLEIQGLTPEYLKLKQRELGWSEEKQEKINFLLKKIFCSELNVLLPFLSHNPNPALFHKIIQNKKRWFNSLESMWEHEEYSLFTNGRYFFSNLLEKAGLKNEYEKWLFELVLNYDFSKINDSSTSEQTITWLKAAGDGIRYIKALDSDSIIEWVEYWESWIKDQDNNDENIFNNTMMFLETYYRLKMDWNSRKNLSFIGLKFYEKNENYEQVITTMKSIARCEEALGNMKECYDYEEKMMNQIPFEKLKEGIKQNTILDVIFCKMNRKEYDEVQTLINDFNILPKVGDLPKVGEMVQGDLYIKLDRLEDAMAIYSRLWAGVIKKEHVVNPEKIVKTLNDLESEMESERFNEIFKENAPGVDTPSELSKKQQEMAQMPQMLN